MKVIILAGGKGTRLEPYTTILPKPLVPVVDKPILDIIIRQLTYYGFKDIVLTVGYLAELIQAYFKSSIQDLKNVKISYVRENQPTGTAGSLRQIPGITKTFLVMNGDLLTTLDYRKLIAFHIRKNAILTIAMHKKRVKIDLGVMEADKNDFLLSYHEKPEKIYKISMGIYVYELKVLDYIQPNTYLDFPQLVNILLDNKERVAVYPCDDFWLDIGNHEDFIKAQEEFLRLRHKILPMAKKRVSYT